MPQVVENTRRAISELPGPKGKPIIGNLTEFGHDPLTFLSECAQNYGEIIPMQLGLSPACLLTQPEVIASVLKNREAFAKVRGKGRILHAFFGEGLISSEGDSWFRQRRIAQPIFHQKRIAGYGEVMVAQTEQMLSQWRNGETINFDATIMDLTLSILMKTVFNQEVNAQATKTITHAVNEMMDWFESKRKQIVVLGDWFPSPENLRYKQAIQQMDQTIYNIIHQRRASGEDPGDLLSMFMQARDEDDGSQMSDQQLRDELATLMGAGHETTSHTLSWTFMLLAQHPEVEAKLRQELKEVLNGRTPTVTDIPKLRYTNWIIKEAQRLYPEVWMQQREASQDCEIGGYHIPKNCMMLMSPWVMHRNPRYFDEPELFKPERWDNDLEKQLPRGVYFPFGDGPRTCIGKGFALMELVLVLATIAQKVWLSLIPDQFLVPQPSITLRFRDGLKMTVNQRLS